ncbi:MAG: hypothetical protein MUE55_02360 [Thermoplasmata archaeon]|nr:hypothetical protein [Thermoplasmata archaeon]
MAVSFASLAAAEEEPAVPVPIMVPEDGLTTKQVAVYFADNMAFGPQWRVGNLVRIETAIVNLDKFWDGSTADLITPDLLPVDLAQSRKEPLVYDELTGTWIPNLYTQADIMADPYVLFDTFMVSVSQIKVTIYNIDDSEYTYSFESDFTDGVQDADEVTREINKAGHLIYGFLWDTTGIIPGIYKVDVTIPSVWTVNYALQTAYPVVEEEEVVILSEDVEVDPIGFTPIPVDNGGVIAETNTAWVQLGDLIEKSDSGSTGGGGNGDHDGGGDGGDGNMNGGGNGNGQLGTLMNRHGR